MKIISTLLRRTRFATAAMALAASASAQTVVFDFCMTGDEENPPINTPATGMVTVTVDTTAMTVQVDGTFQNLSSNATAAHIHGPAPIGMNAGIMIGLTPTGMTSGTITGGGNLTATQMNTILTEMSYVNLHSVMHGGGEIRGQIDNVVGTNYCVGSPNSAGSGASISASGCYILAENDFTLHGSGLPASAPGLFFFGSSQVNVPFGDGRRCVGGSIVRIQPPVFASGGELSKVVDLAFPPIASHLMSGGQTNFQLWYRDPMGPGGSGFNTSDGLAVVWK